MGGGLLSEGFAAWQWEVSANITLVGALPDGKMLWRAAGPDPARGSRGWDQGERKRSRNRNVPTPWMVWGPLKNSISVWLARPSRE